MRIAVLGAAGLVGNVLVQRLRTAGEAEVRACVRNPATSWSLLRLGIELIPADLRDSDSLDRAITGCSHVVNCALGDDRELVPCMQNLVATCRRHGVRRLVHLSSVTAYGDPPGPDSIRESGIPRPQRGTYGWFKLRQDEIALSACDGRLSVAVLCLPHVTGPNSRFLLSLIGELREGRLALIDGGRHPVVLADVHNVSRAIELALTATAVDGRRIFVNDGSPPSWRTLIERLAPLANRSIDSVPDFQEGLVLASHASRLSWREALRLLLALPEVRDILRRTSVGGEGALAARTRAILKRSSVRPTVVWASAQDEGCPRPAAGGLWRQQLRKVPHSIDRAKAVLGFEPVVSFEQSMDAFHRWFAATYDHGTEYRELASRG